MKHTTLCVLDADSRRRAAIAHSLIGTGIHVEPFESVSELSEHGPKDGEVILAYDDEGAIADLLAKLSADSGSIPIVAYREAPEIRRVVYAVQRGVDDYVCWPFSAPELMCAIDRAIAAEGDRPKRSRERAARSRLQALSTRERQVLAGLAGGLTNRGIAEHLQISPRTVEVHRSNLMNKVQARGTGEAIRLAVEANLLPDS